MNDINVLILDFGFYAENSALRPVISAISRDPGNEIMHLDAGTMSDNDWDGVLDKLLNAKRCITL
jgi:hypothetical protein